ncbi:MAG: phosphate signaling complex protein PhoU [Gammaproteobacteria bacterium]|nr:phosphate signaling complex protein PhoU [Gammaproteobacteria bacterium]
MEKQHISQQFDAELERLRSRVFAMGGLVEQQVRDAVRALTDGDIALADKVITNDYKVNLLEVELDEECTHILARRQPTAGDLRLVVTVIKAITDLERMGDQAEKVARMGKALAELERPRNGYMEIQSLGNHVQGMIRDTLDAFARMDATAAITVAKEDLKVDLEYEGIMRQSITFMMEDPRAIKRVLDVMWAARALERIGDHSRNICEYVIYLVKGKDVRHISLEQMAEELQLGPY